jgi:hypothetical protein
MFTEAEQVIIEEVASLPEKEQSYKINLIKLKAIKFRVTGTPEKECFCSSVRRKIWYKDFRQWYETYYLINTYLLTTKRLGNILTIF